MENDFTFFIPENIRTIANAFQHSKILLTAIELDLFSVIDKHMLTSNEVSQKLNTDERATDRLMNALYTMGFLRKVRGKFYNTESSSQYLVKGKPDFMGGLYHSIGLWNSWSYLTESVRKGSCVELDISKKKSVDWNEAFISAMHYRGQHQAKIICLLLNLSNVNRILDVGGGSGAFTFEFLKTSNTIDAVIFDLPSIIPITKKYVENSGYAGRIKLVEGDYLKDEFPGKFDLIFLSAIVHINSNEQNGILIKKCFDALNSGGTLIIKDYIMNSERTEPSNGAVFALNMLVNTQHGDTYTENEMREWFTSAGFSKIEKKETSFDSNLLIGIKD